MSGKDGEALIVVDVQNDFCPGGSLAVEKGDEVVMPLNLMIDHAQMCSWAIIASRDWHPKRTSHFKTWPVHCVKDTKGAEFHPDLSAYEDLGVITVSKGTKRNEDGYSAFDGTWLEDPAKRSLDQILKEIDVGKLYIGGLATDYCVKATALDAIRRGYEVFLLLDACRAVNLNKDKNEGDPSDEEGAIQEMKDAGVIISNTQEVMSGGA